jgi:hypothetical protein
MIVMNPEGVMPVGPWQLPSEFARPNWTTLSSGSSQQILEARGLMSRGYGRMNSAAGARVVERLPWSRYAGNVDLY